MRSDKTNEVFVSVLISALLGCLLGGILHFSISDVNATSCSTDEELVIRLREIRSSQNPDAENPLPWPECARVDGVHPDWVDYYVEGSRMPWGAFQGSGAEGAVNIGFFTEEAMR